MKWLTEDSTWPCCKLPLAYVGYKHFNIQGHNDR